MSIDPTPFNVDDENSSFTRSPFLIGVAGGSASGKKTVCNMIMDKLLPKHVKVGRKVVVISLGDFYREFNEDEKRLAEQGEFDFDHPDAFDFDLVAKIIDDLKSGKKVTLPTYNFYTRKRDLKAISVYQPDVVLFEGILILYEKRIRDSLSMKIFVDVDSDTRLAQRVIQDTEKRHHHPLEYVLNQYLKYVKPAYEDFVLPTKKTSDVIIPRGADNIPAIKLISSHIEDLLKGRDEHGSLRLRISDGDIEQTGRDDELRTSLSTPTAVLDTPQLFISVPR
ncbi:hypothetical protein G9A89_010816 [Geosiphon pyriformis]|nr:hypothetical protein G9A89_010816 [Geosiphon pyriformis]